MTQIMPIEKQVVNLKLAKKLKELNCPQESLFYWSGEIVGYFGGHPGKYYEKYSGSLLSAFTVAELGDMLPLNYTTERLDSDV